MKKIVILIFIILTIPAFADDRAKINYFSVNNPNSIYVRHDYIYYLDLKYFAGKKIEYLQDVKGYYYLSYYIQAGKRRFGKKIRFPIRDIEQNFVRYKMKIDLLSQAGEITAYDKINKKTLWTILLDSAPTLPPFIQGSMMLISTESGRFYCINRFEGKIAWTFLTPGSILINPILTEKYIIIMDDSGNIFWLNKENGSYSKKVVLESMPLPNPIVRGNYLYIANSRGYAYSININDATHYWRDNLLNGAILKTSYREKGILVKSSSTYLMIDYMTGKKTYASKEEIGVLEKE